MVFFLFQLLKIFSDKNSRFVCVVKKMYLVLVCALLELFELIVEHSELPSDALYPSVQTPVLTVLCVEIVFIPLTLLRRTNYCITSRRGMRINVTGWPRTKCKH